MKKILTTLSIAAMLAMGIGRLAACSDSSASTGGGSATGYNNSTYNSDVSEVFNETDTSFEVYGFSAASAAMIISSMNEVQTAQAGAVSAASTFKTATGAAVTDKQTIDTLNNYMTLVENLLGTGRYMLDLTVSDDKNYSVKLSISCGNMSDENFEYTMYYNETLVSENTKKDGGETEVEQVYTLEGVIYIDGASYPLSGRKEVSTESDLFSTETETEHQLTITLSQTSYMKVEQEISEEGGESGQEYKYSIYENGVMTESCSFEYERENGEMEIEMRQSIRNSSGTLETQTFCFEKETRLGKEAIKIKVGGSTGTETYTVTIETDENGGSYYVYTLNNGQTYNKNRG